MDKQTVLEMAKIARLDVSDEEAEDLAREFEEVLELFGKIDEVGCEEAEDKAKPPSILREDKAEKRDGEGGWMKGPRTV